MPSSTQRAASREPAWPADAVERWPLERIHESPRNPRTHSEEQIAQVADSMREFGWTMPVLVDETGELIAGHGRVRAARLLGFTDAPVMIARGWSETQIRAYRIADNKLALNAGWDEELLRIEFGALSEVGFDLSLTGFDSRELDDLLGPDGDAEGADDDDAPACPELPVSVPGDVWVCGPHRVMCGDALNGAQMAKLMDGEPATLVVTDPPYNVAYEGKTSERLTIVNDAMSEKAFRAFLLAAFENMMAHCIAGAPAYVFHADTQGANFRRAFTEAGWYLAQCAVWVKPVFVMGRQDYHWQHEPVLYGWKPGAAHRWYADRSQSTTWAFDRPSRSEVHPTMKPVALLEYLLTNSSQRGDVVLDAFGGSGSTLIACARMKRAARLMELDPRYCDVIVRRWQEFSGERAIREADGASFDSPVEAGVGRQAATL
ncbi:site-specific DNA-methyltransferase [Paraburkholderia sp. 35.1]|uniref:site-specific DNA-methyltransferase n=1 Tax=Paraburkholderia sp. 35.1 TaxID=2991058 RepID=UPI003D199202